MANNLRPWRSFTIFVSSTFIDMEAERDYLNNIVTRELEREYEKKRVSLNFVDLRWGVLTDKEAGKETRELSVLNVCMEEIKRSRPFFIALLGHRYGWIPPKERFRKMLESMNEEDRRLLKDGEGASVTALEILYGAIGDNSLLNHSLFYFRDSASYANMTKEELSLYHDDRYAGKLQQLKDRIVDECHKQGLDNVHSYCLEWNDGCFTRLEGWGEQIKSHLRQEIDAELEETAFSSPANWLEMEDMQQDIFIHSRMQLFVGRQKELAELERFATDERGTVVLTGFPTTGKSALLCQLFQRLQKVPELLVLLHCTGVSQYANYTYRMFCRLAAHICRELDLSYIEPDNTGNKARNYFLDLVHQVTATGRKVVLLIDSTNAFNPSDDASNYSWLPDEACCILTCERTQESGYEKEITLYKQDARVMHLPFLSREEARILVREQCRLFHKSIPENVLELIINKKADEQSLPEGYPQEYYACYDPLWIKLIVRLLVSLDENDFAEARQMKDETDEEIKLEKFLCQCVIQAPVDPTNLIVKSFFPKIMQDIDYSFFYKVLIGIALSQGLSENDMSALFDYEWDSLSFSKIHHYLKDVLVEDYETGAWRFSHVRVEQIFLSMVSDDLCQKFIHALGNYYYTGMGKSSPNAARKAIYFLSKGNRMSRAAYFCSSPKLVENDIEDIVEEIVENIKFDEKAYLPWFISMFSLLEPDGEDVDEEMWIWMEQGGYQRLYIMAIQYLLPRLEWWKNSVALQFAQGIETVVKNYTDNHPDDSTVCYLLHELYYRMAYYFEATGEPDMQKKYMEYLSELKSNDLKQASMAVGVQMRVALNEADYPKAEQLCLSYYQESKLYYQSSSEDPQAAYEAFMGCMYLIDVYRQWEKQDRLTTMVEEAFTYLPSLPVDLKYQKIKGSFYYMAGQMYDNQGQSKKALELLEKSIDLLTAIHTENLRDNENAIELGIAYETLGAYYEKQNQLECSLECYYKQVGLFDDVLAIDTDNEVYLHFRLIATCHLWDVLQLQSGKTEEWQKANNDLVWLSRRIDHNLLTEHDLWRIGPAHFYLGTFWETLSPEKRPVSSQVMFSIMKDGWMYLQELYDNFSHNYHHIEMGLSCLYSRLGLAADNNIPTDEPLTTLLQAYSVYPPSDSELGQYLNSQIKQFQPILEKVYGKPFVKAFHSEQYIEAIQLYQDKTSPTEREQLLYGLCLLRADFRKKAVETFTLLRNKVQDDRENWLLITLNMSVCHLLEGNLSEFKKLFKELSDEERALDKCAFLWKACVEKEALSASDKSWYKRLLGKRPSTKELRIMLPKPYGWSEL